MKNLRIFLLFIIMILTVVSAVSCGKTDVDVQSDPVPITEASVESTVSDETDAEPDPSAAASDADLDLLVNMMNSANGMLYGGCAGTRISFDCSTASVSDMISMGLLGGYFGNGGCFEACGGLYSYFSDEDLSSAICWDPENRFVAGGDLYDSYKYFSTEGNSLRLDAELSKWILNNVLGISDIPGEGHFKVNFTPGDSFEMDFQYYFKDGYLYIEASELYANLNRTATFDNSWIMVDKYDLGNSEYGFVLKNTSEYVDYLDYAFIKAEIAEDSVHGRYWKLKNISRDHVCFDIDDKAVFDKYTEICREWSYNHIIEKYYPIGHALADIDGNGTDELLMKSEGDETYLSTLQVYTWNGGLIYCGEYEFKSESGSVSYSNSVIYAENLYRGESDFDVIRFSGDNISAENTVSQTDPNAIKLDFVSLFDAEENHLENNFPELYKG